jgi:hypothetical protein
MIFGSRRWILAGAFFVLLAAAGGVFYFYHFRTQPAAVAATQYKTLEESDMYVRFDMDVYDIITTNYWQKAPDADMAGLFQLALAKALNTQTPPEITTKDRAGTAKMLAGAMANATSTQNKIQLAENVAIVALYNLAPQGRSGMLSQKQETELRQTVSNVHPNTDLYKDLGVAKGASADDVEKAYKEKESALKNATSSEDKAALAQADYAHKVLTNDSSKNLYDTAKIEPTIFGHVLGKTLYVNMTQVSPTSLQEFARAVDNASTTPGLESLIVDMRGNIGGALDFAAAFLGLFMGQNQYAYDLFHQGDYQVQRTTLAKFDEINRYTDIAFLVDNMSQSTAELTTAVFKKFHLAHVVGKTTRGWGTVENTFPIEADIDPTQKFTVLLVHSLTLREDNQPIEGRGVDPDVDVSKTDWQSQLSKYFSSPSLISALKQTANKPPLK